MGLGPGNAAWGYVHARARIFVPAESGKFEVAILHVQGVPVFSPRAKLPLYGKMYSATNDPARR